MTNNDSVNNSYQLEEIANALFGIENQLKETRKALFFSRPKGWEENGYYEGVEEDDWLEGNNIVASLKAIRNLLEETNDLIKDQKKEQVGFNEESPALSLLERQLGSIGTNIRYLTSAITVLVIVFILKLLFAG
jgi:hypothetical protein